MLCCVDVCCTSCCIVHVLCCIHACCVRVWLVHALRVHGHCKRNCYACTALCASQSFSTGFGLILVVILVVTRAAILAFLFLVFLFWFRQWPNPEEVAAWVPLSCQ